MKADTTKRTDWDMFAEQDIDSNFDVSHISNWNELTMNLTIDIHLIAEPFNNYLQQKHNRKSSPDR